MSTHQHPEWDTVQGNSAHLTYAPVAPALAEAGFATYLPRKIDPAYAILLSEDNLDQIADAIGGKVTTGRVRRLHYPAMGHRGPTTMVAEIGDVLVQINEGRLDPWRRDKGRNYFHDTSPTSLDRDYFLPGQPQHLDPAPAPEEDAEHIRSHIQSHPDRQGRAYKLTLAMDIYDRLAEGDTEVLRDEQLYAASYLRDLARSDSRLPLSVEKSMDRLAHWMINQPSSTRTPVTDKGARFTDDNGNSYTDLGDGTLRTGGIQRFLDYNPVEPTSEVLFRSGPLTRIPLDD